MNLLDLAKSNRADNYLAIKRTPAARPSSRDKQSTSKDFLIIKQTPTALPSSRDKQDYLHHDLNPLHDTRHDSKVVDTYGGRRIDGSSRRTRRHDEKKDSKLGTGPVVLN
jgi:hypothetical protein